MTKRTVLICDRCGFEADAEVPSPFARLDMRTSADRKQHLAHLCPECWLYFLAMMRLNCPVPSLAETEPDDRCDHLSTGLTELLT